jgi:hypothetical protein
MPETDATIDEVPDLAVFLKGLAEEGRAVVWPGPLAGNPADALIVLCQFDELARHELGLEAPEFSREAALWAAQLVYHLSQFTVCRDIGEEQTKAACEIPCPGPHGPAAHWSVDLTLRHLPRLFQFARHLSNGDPLVQQMKKIATAWPLSSVGIGGLENLQLDPFIGHPALRRLYADRIVAAGDTSRLGDARVDDLLRADLGLHHELAPAIASKLFSKNHDTH